MPGGERLSASLNGVGPRFLTPLLILMTLDFLLTPNPFSALHGGVLYSPMGVDRWAFPPVYLIVATVAFGVLRMRAIRLDLVTLVMGCAAIATGLVTGILFERPQTYALDGFSLCLLSAAASSDLAVGRSGHRRALTPEALVGLLFVLGLALVFLGGTQYGYLPFGFSRLTRGEVTLWQALGFPVILPALTFAAVMTRRKSARWLILLYLVMVVVLISCYSRLAVLVAVTPLLALLFARVPLSRPLKWTFVLAILAGLAGTGVLRTAIEKFVYLETSSLEYGTTGRLELLLFYWAQFLQQPLLGVGPFFLDRFGYTGIATSEIGGIKVLSEYGILYGLPFFYLWFRGTAAAVRVLFGRDRERDAMRLFCAYAVLGGTMGFLFEGMARVLSVAEAVYWYALLYLPTSLGGGRFVSVPVWRILMPRARVASS